MEEFILKIILLVLPMYIANASAMLLGGGTPIDFGKKFPDKRPFLGKGKTWNGLISGFLLGTIFSLIVYMLLPEFTRILTENYFVLGMALSAGALFGDITASFIKRRLNFKSGHPWFLIDQLDFVAGGILAGMFYYSPNAFEILTVFILTIFAHVIANFIAFKIKIKNVPW